jgi:hypothetical protein
MLYTEHVQDSYGCILVWPYQSAHLSSVLENIAHFMQRDMGSFNGSHCPPMPNVARHDAGGSYLQSAEKPTFGAPFGRDWISECHMTGDEHRPLVHM